MTKVKTIYREIDNSTPVLDRYELAVGDTVRFRRRDDEHWLQGSIKGDSKDGSIMIVDRDGRWCSIMPDKVQVSVKGPRGGRAWKSVE